MKFRDIFRGLIAVLLASLALNIFLPGWFIKVVVGTIAVFFIFNWLTNLVNLDKLWVKRIGRLAIILFIVNLTYSSLQPWVKRAWEQRRVYFSYFLADKVDPNQPLVLAMTLHETELMRLEKEEEYWIQTLQILQDKLKNGEQLNSADRALLDKAPEALLELARQRAAINLSVARSVSTSEAKSKGIESAAKQTYTFPDGEDVIEVPLHPTKWSKRIEFPEDAVRFKAITPPGKKIKLKDWRGRILDGSGWSWIQADISNKVIRLSGEDTAIVTIERR